MKKAIIGGKVFTAKSSCGVVRMTTSQEADWMSLPVIFISGRHSEKVCCSSVLPMELLGIAFASLIPDVAPGFEGLVTDSEVSMTMLNQPKKLTNGEGKPMSLC